MVAPSLYSNQTIFETVPTWQVFPPIVCGWILKRLNAFDKTISPLEGFGDFGRCYEEHIIINVEYRGDTWDVDKHLKTKYKGLTSSSMA